MTRLWDIRGDDIKMWAQRVEASSDLPELVRRLLLATTPLDAIDMRADGGTRLGGWDGTVLARRGTTYCPPGASVWELTTNSETVKKFNQDFEKRAAEAKTKGLSGAVYVSVTAQRFPEKGDWADKKKKQGAFREVRALDADDLATWLALAPAVARWFGVKLGRPAYDLVDLDTFAAAWGGRTQPPLPLQMNLIGRERERAAEAIRQWGHAARPSQLVVRADTRDDALAFAAAALACAPGQAAESFRARTLVAESREALRWAQGSAPSEPLILLPNFEDFELKFALRSNLVVVPLPGAESAPAPAGNEIHLLPIPYRRLADALRTTGLSDDEAGRLAEESGGKMAALQRALGYAARPPWVDRFDRTQLATLLLVGAWQPENEADRDVVRALGVEPNDLQRLCEDLAIVSDAATIKDVTRWDKATWAFQAPEDAWRALIGLVPASVLQRFTDVVVKVLGRDDPRYELPPDERFYAPLRGKTIQESAGLREGMATTLARLSRSDRPLAPLHGPGAGSRVAATAVARLLEAPWLRWASLADLLPLLAEAAPSTFLSRLEESLALGDKGVAHLLDEESTYGHPHAGLLWALETLAWAPQHMPRVVRALVKLAERDAELGEAAGKVANRPVESLARILHLLLPQTTASVDERVRILRAILTEGGSAAEAIVYPMLVGALKGVGRPGVMMPHRQPKFFTERLLSDEEQRQRARSEARLALERVLSLVVEYAGANAARWVALVRALASLPSDDVAWVLQQLLARQDQLNERREQVWLALLDRAAQARDARPRKAALEQTFRQAAAAFEPAEELPKLGLLFGPNAEVVIADLPPLREADVQRFSLQRREREQRILTRRREALNELKKRDDPWGQLEELAQRVPDKDALGFALGQSSFAPELEARFLDPALAPVYALLFEPYVRGRWFGLAEGERAAWAEHFLRSLADAGRSSEATRAAHALPASTRLWAAVEALGDPVRHDYWATLTRVYEDEPSNPDYWQQVVESLLAAGNVRVAFEAAGSAASNVKPATAARVLGALLDDQVALSSFAGDDGRLHLFEQVLNRLEGASDVDPGLVRKAEVTYVYLSAHDDERSRTQSILTDEFTQNPGWFAELVSQIYRREGEERTASEEGRARAEQAYRLLDLWRGYPGEGLPSAEGEEVLYAWAREALRLTAEQGRPVVGAIEVAKVLARPPAAADGHWPCLAARRLLRQGNVADLGRFLAIAKRNLRGVWTRELGEDGNQERELARTFRVAADAMRAEWTETAAMLDELAHAYEREADEEDAQAAATLRREGLEPSEGKRPPAAPPSPPAGPSAAIVGDRVVALRSVRLRDLGAFETLQVDFEPPGEGRGQWVVLLGENGAGKTTLLRALAFALGGTNMTAAALAKLPASAVRFGASGEGECGVETTEGVTYSTTIKAGVRLEVGRVTPDEAVARPLLFAYGCRRGSALGGAEPASSEAAFSDVATLFDEHERLLPARGRLKDLWVRTLGSDPGNVRRNIYQQVMTKLRHLLPDEVERIEVDAEDVWVVSQALGGRVPLASLSDGYLTTLGWAADLILRWLEWAERLGISPVGDFFHTQMCGLVLLDEIDLHLHPSWQRDVIKRVREVFPKMSFVVTTHNPLTLLGARAEEIWVLRRHAEGIAVERGLESPALMTSGQIYEAYFGITSLFPHELGEKLRRYGFLAGTPARTDDEEAEVYRLQKYLRDHNADPGWAPVPRESPPDFFDEAGQLAGMIRVERGPEPAALTTARGAELGRLRALHATRGKVDWSKFGGYRSAARDLWSAQFHKCCYCETQVRQVHNDVEHFRPKAEADRGEHCADTHGYWWLAYTWENLLFSCAACNRPPAKDTQFPLAAGSVALSAEELPPGHEAPLLIDPASEDGVEHIQFRPSAGGQWRPFARGGSRKGQETIRVCRLDRDDLIEIYTAHVEQHVLREVDEVERALAGGVIVEVKKAHWWAERRLLSARLVMLGLSYDALLHYVPNERLAPFGCRWPRPPVR
ncbi:MAG TPA: AAA family ATPase [Polyangiaceae bacterium]|nr:AAA family ATPase [Polyangiaceae bacterium]